LPDFDTPDERSPFLTFVASETGRRNTDLRRALGNKVTARDPLIRAGIPTAERFALIEDPGEIAGMDLPDRFVLKYGRGHSSRGVMVLTRDGPDVFWCDVLRRRLALADIIERQRAVYAHFDKGRRWIVEQALESTIPGKPLPLDHKFYCFQSEIGCVIQIDRNVSPPAISLLGPDFAPLRPLEDFVMVHANAQLGIPVVPRHADRMRDAARRAARMTDAPFVSVDFYDTPEGPVFGEFTFSPGGTHRRLWRFSGGMLARLDAAFARAEAALGTGRAVETTPLQGEPRIDGRSYARLAPLVLGRSPEAARTLAAIARDGTPAGEEEADAWDAIADHVDGQVRQTRAAHFAALKRARAAAAR
jgi:hypothetical protein